MHRRSCAHALAILFVCFAAFIAQSSQAQEGPTPSPTPRCPSDHTWTGQADADGKATERVQPDLASVSITVSSTKQSPASARNSGQASFDDVLEALTEAGLNDTSIQTTGLSVEPNYDTDYYRPQGQLPTNFTFSQTIAISSTPDELGSYIDVATEAGGSDVSIGQINLYVSPTLSATTQNRLRSLAVKNALASLDSLISASEDAAIAGTVMSITDNTYPPYVPFGGAAPTMRAGELADGAPAAPTEIFAGLVDIDAQVRVRVAICTQG